MNKELILARISQIEMEMESLKSQFSSLNGHLLENKHWLSVLDADEIEKSNAVEPTEARDIIDAQDETTQSNGDIT